MKFHIDSGHGSQIPSSDDNEWDGADERQYIRVIRSSAVTRLLTLLKEIATTDGKWIIDNVRPICFLYVI